MSLLSVKVNNFRNIVEANLKLSPCCNIFYGNNGAGKTSFLEVIYYLGMGRSFRSNLFRRVINYNAKSFELFAEVEQKAKIIPIGLMRSQDGDCKIRMSGEDVSSFAELVKLLPVQLVTQNGYDLFNAGAKLRCRFIDWGVFHVEHSFVGLWRKMNRALRQRNSALKGFWGRQDVKIWDDELVSTSLAIHKLREKYVKDLMPPAFDLLNKLLGEFKFAIEYYPGWDTSKELQEILSNNFLAEQKAGFTKHGAHRADLRFSLNGLPVQHVLSRGQQKLFFFALLLAQGLLLRQNSPDKRCIYLIDDLASELDMERKELIAAFLDELDAQIFITCLDEADVRLFLRNDTKMFHVKHGAVEDIGK